MLRKTLKYFVPFSFLLLPACATLPIGPSVMVAPAVGKPFELFKQEDASCRRWAEQQMGLSPQDAIDKNSATGAITGTAIGAGLGALLGSASGHAGPGALVGAAGGMLMGAASGADSGRVYGRKSQRRYDIAYLQCMYSYDNRPPESSRIRRSYRTHTTFPPPSWYRDTI
ncbi:MAG: glycine zipper family protein [Desulfuromonadaceae bacterium]|nr:glycine zipper family protein [Desulfuromonadaceae bacterium]